MSNTDDQARFLRRRWGSTQPPEGTTEPREEPCFDPSCGRFRHARGQHFRPSPPAPATEGVPVTSSEDGPTTDLPMFDRKDHPRHRFTPAAEDEAVVSAVQEALAVGFPDLPESKVAEAATAATRAALDSAGVSALRAEVAEWRRVATEQTRMERDRAVAAEAERDEARQQVADLRAGIEAIRTRDDDEWPLDRGPEYREGWWAAAEAMTFLAGSGEQPGEVTRVEVHGRGHGKTQAMAERVADAVKTRGLPAEVLPVPAPVVPDSTGLRERAINAVQDAVDGCIDYETERKIADAVLAVVGQGVTAERAGPYSGPTMDLIEQGHDMSLAPHYPGPGQWCEACPIPEPAVVRSGEQGGDRG